MACFVQKALNSYAPRAARAAPNHSTLHRPQSHSTLPNSRERLVVHRLGLVGQRAQQRVAEAVGVRVREAVVKLAAGGVDWLVSVGAR